VEIAFGLDHLYEISHLKTRCYDCRFFGDKLKVKIIIRVGSYVQSFDMENTSLLSAMHTINSTVVHF
jgi:hypothetical protein